jgi:uncharacterized membrane protein YkvA (DUF1232 family)
MKRNRKSVFTNPSKNLSMLTNLFKQLRLVWLLFRDSRVPFLSKLVLPLSLLYLVSPIDILPDVIVGLGQLDDLSVLLLGMALFVRLCPPRLVDQYRNQLEYGDQEDYDDKDETVDTTYRVVGEE